MSTACSHVLIATLTGLLTHISPFSSSAAAISGSAIRVLPGLKRTNWPQGSQRERRGSNSFFEREGKSRCWPRNRMPSASVLGSVLSVDSPNKMASEQAGNKAFSRGGHNRLLTEEHSEPMSQRALTLRENVWLHEKSRTQCQAFKQLKSLLAIVAICCPSKRASLEQFGH